MFERVSVPEEVGVNSKVLCEFFDKLDELGVENHAFIIIKDDKIAAENYVAPFTGDCPHSEFSVSKSLVATAVGFAIAEGKMTLDTHVLDFYPEYKKDTEQGRRNAEITVRQLLTMASGKKCKFVKDMTKGDYADDWEKYRFRKDNGFMYSNDDVYMLAKAITRIYGCSVIDMLMPRVLEPLGIERPFWETTNQGVEAGATGLRLKPFDLAKIAYCYLNHGLYNGKQVIPHEWTEVVGQTHITLPGFYGNTQTYGYYMWGDPHGGYRFDGMYGQWAWIFPCDNAVLVMNDLTCRAQEVIEEIIKFFPRAFREPIAENGAEYTKKLAERFEKNKTYNLPASKHSPIEERVSKLTFGFKKYSHADFIGYPISVLPMTVSGTYPKKPKRSMDDVRLRFFDGYAEMSWREDNETNTVQIGTDGKWRDSRATLGTYPFLFRSCGYWKSDDTFYAELRPIETPARRMYEFKFNGDKLKLKVRSVPSVEEFALGNIEEVTPLPMWLIKKPIQLAARIMTPTLKSKGKIK